MSNPAQGAVGAETMTAAERVCHEEQMVIWSSEIAERLAMGDWLREHLSYEDKLGLYADLSEGIRSIVGTAFALASPRADSDERTAGEDITVEGAPGNRLAPWLLSGSDEEVIEALMRRSAGDVACLFFPTPVNVADPIRRTYYEGRPPRQQRLLAELLCRLKPATPAQPAGAVPDSLRALSEAATPFAACVFNDNGDITISTGSLSTNDWLRLSRAHRALNTAFSGGAKSETPHDVLTSIRLAIASVDVHAEASEYEFRAEEVDHTPTDAERAMLEDFGEQILSHLEAALLASHPAGQGAGSGAETVGLNWKLDDEAKEYLRSLDTATVHPGDPRLNTMVGPAGPAAGMDGYGSQARPLSPAPDSTRTGQGEAEERLIGPKMTPEQEAQIAHNLCGEFGPDAVIANASFVKAFYAELYAAARPAAPEAQGVWSFDMEAAPRDGSDVEIVNDRGQFIARFDRSWGRSYADAGWWMVSDGKDPERPLRGDEPFAWRIPTKAPAPPTSSGQGGR